MSETTQTGVHKVRGGCHSGPMFGKPKQTQNPSARERGARARELFESRTEVWREVGLGEEIDRGQVQRARGGVVLIVLAIAGVLFAFSQRDELFPGMGTEVRIATVGLLVVLGWALARNLGQGVAPSLFRRLDPGVAGTVGFTIRLATVVIMLIVALRIAGLNAGTIAAGGAFTAVVLGLAAQQTLGNLFAGMVLLSTRPFKVGERVRLTGGAVAGSVEGIVGSLGLFYTTLVSGADRIMVPNAVLLNLAVVPLREPDRVDMRARFPAATTPTEVQRRLTEQIRTPTRYAPHISLEELDGDEVIVRIIATPERPSDGARLASEVLSAIRGQASGAQRVRDDGFGEAEARTHETLASR